jgi:hypothetical protein
MIELSRGAMIAVVVIAFLFSTKEKEEHRNGDRKMPTKIGSAAAAVAAGMPGE